MSYYYAESAVAGPNQQKLVIEVWTTPDVNAINWDTNTVQIRALARTYQALYSGDNQTFNRTGSWGGSSNYYMPATANTWVTLADQTWNVSTQQGSGVHLDIDGNITGHYSGASFATGVDVDIAARPYPTSQPTLSANNFNMGTTVTINTNRLNSGFTHNLYFYVGGTEVYRAMGVGASTTWNFPVATLGPYAPSSTALAGIIYCDTMNGGSLVGSSSVGWTAKVPSSVVPVIGTTVVSDANTTVVSNVGQYVKLLSKLKVQLTGCAGAHGSSVSKHEVTVSNITYDITNLDSAGASSLLHTFSTAIMSSGTVAVKGKVTDSRGRAATKTTNITVLDYSLPNPTELTVQRCDSAGTLNTLGTYVKVTTKGTTKSLVNSTERNNLAYQVDYRQVGTTPWLALKAKTTQAALTLDSVETLGSGQFSPVNSYEFMLTLYDKFNNVAITSTTGTSEVTLSLNKSGIGVGKVWSKGSIDTASDIFVGGGVYPNNQLLSASTNLNDFVTSGIYVQPVAANATLANGYPVAEAGYLTNGGAPALGMAMQTYTTLGTLTQYGRRMESGTWTAWAPLDSGSGNWNTLSLLNGWEVADALSYPVLQYKVTGNQVHLRGMIKHSTTSTVGIIANMPSGTRPLKMLILTAMTSGGLARIDVGANGDLWVQGYRAGGNGSYVSLTGLTYWLD